jgi:hypothetical protein
MGFELDILGCHSNAVVSLVGITEVNAHGVVACGCVPVV